MTTAKLAAEYAALLLGNEAAEISHEKLTSLLCAANLDGLEKPIMNLLSTSSVAKHAGEGDVGMGMTSHADEGAGESIKMTSGGQEGEGQMGMTMTSTHQDPPPNPFEYRSGTGNRMSDSSFVTATAGDAAGNMGMKSGGELMHANWAYIVLRLGGNMMPTKDDVREVLGSVGKEVNEDALIKMITEMEGKDLNELIAGDGNLGSKMTW